MPKYQIGEGFNKHDRQWTVRLWLDNDVKATIRYPKSLSGAEFRNARYELEAALNAMERALSTSPFDELRSSDGWVIVPL